MAQLLNDLQQRGISIQSAEKTRDELPPVTKTQTLLWLQRIAIFASCIALIVVGRLVPGWIEGWRASERPPVVRPTELTPEALEQFRSEYAQWQAADANFQITAAQAARQIEEIEAQLQSTFTQPDDFQATHQRMLEAIQRLQADLQTDQLP